MIVDVPPPVIVQIAQRVRQQEQGTLLYQLRRLFDVSAGSMRRTEELELAVVTQQADTVKVRVLRSLVDGKPTDQARVTQIESQYEHPKPGDVFHRPFDPSYLQEYTYQALDAKTYRFTSLVHDSAHGDGTFTVDGDGNVVSYEYTENVLPEYATSGTVTVNRSEVLPGVWEMTREVYSYRGRYGILAGRATATISYDSYRRYPDVPAAAAALDNIALKP